jgi:nicotinamide-nucleotide amidase
LPLTLLASPFECEPSFTIHGTALYAELESAIFRPFDDARVTGIAHDPVWRQWTNVIREPRISASVVNSFIIDHRNVRRWTSGLYTGNSAVNDLILLAETIAARLKAQRQSIAIAESSTGGLISAALLALPGASAYFLGGAVVYTRQAKILLLGLDEAGLTQFRSATERHALLLARGAQARFAAGWGLGETGATGPTGNRYGDPAGHTCLAVAGTVERVITIETGSADRFANMHAFAAAGLKLLADTIPP